MRCLQPSRALLATAVLVFVAGSAPAVSAEGSRETNRRDALTFRFVGESDGYMQETIGDGPGQRIQFFDSVTSFDYTQIRSGSEVDLMFERVALRMRFDGNEIQNVQMSRDGVRERRGGQWTETRTEDADPKLRKLLRDSFGAPLVRVTVDENGREIKRVHLARIGAMKIVNAGVIHNTRLIHAPFFDDRTEWTAPATIPMGESGGATGSLTYRKARPAAGDPPHLVRVNVVGAVTNERKTGKQTNMWKDNITGEQIYDTRLREWVGAQWIMDMSYASYEARGKVGSWSATMTIGVAAVSPHVEIPALAAAPRAPSRSSTEPSPQVSVGGAASPPAPDTHPSPRIETELARARPPSATPSTGPRPAVRPGREAPAASGVQSGVRVPIKYDAGFGVNFAIGVAIVGGESFTMEPGGRVIKVLARGAHTVRIVDPKAGFFHKPDWAPYEVTLDLASLDEPMVILEARNRGYKWVLSVRILSASAEVEKHEIAIR